MSLAKAGRYQIQGELGRGAMGVVYRGYDPTIGRTVAIKTILLEAGDPEMLKRFRREAHAAGILSHPNIVTIYDAGEDNGVFYIAMELVEGETLQKVLARGSLPLEQACPIVEQVGAALDHAHGRQIIHRDIKPANIILSGGVAKVMDFGVAKMASAAITSTGQVLGTPSYMSPELVKGAAVDGRSDIFSLGVVLYEMLTGAKPFVGDTITTVIYKIIGEQPEPPSAVNPALDPGLNAVVLKALAKDPNERYAACAELAADLKSFPARRAEGKVSARAAAWAAGPAAAAPGHPAAKEAPGLAGAPGRQPEAVVWPPAGWRKKSLLALVGVGALAAALGGVWKLSQRPEPAARGSEAGRIAAPAPARAARGTPGRAPAATGAGKGAPLTASVEIVTNPAGAEVVVNGRRQPSTTPSRYSLTYGEHQVSIRKSGYRTVERVVKVSDKSPPRVSVNLVAEAGARTAAVPAQAVVGRVLVRTRPRNALILVDGKATDYRSPVNFELPPGKHRITVEQRGFQSETRQVVVRKNQTVELDLELKAGGERGRRFPFLPR